MSDGYVVSSVVGAPTKAVILKDPNATLDYTLDWTAWMALYPTDTIASLSVVLQTLPTPNDTSPLVVVAQGVVSVVADPSAMPTPVVAKHTTTAFISGGLVEQTYKVTFRITTASTPPRIEDRTILLKVKER